MEDVFTFQNIVTIIFLVIYGIIFIIQKSQFQKQNQILEKYDKIFNIINVDEIEKYVQLQKKSTELSISNRETELSNLEVKFGNVHQQIDQILSSSKTTLEKSDEIQKQLNQILKSNKTFVSNLNQLNINEFQEFYHILEEKLTKLNDKNLLTEISNELTRIQKKYYILKQEELKKL
jgi:DNA anti-recombination protein RmuC